MTKKRLFCTVLTLIFLVSLLGCELPFVGKKETETPVPEVVEPEFEPGYPMEYDGVEILEPPQSVVSLSAAVTEKIYDLEMQDVLVGVSDFTDYPSDAAGLQNCGTDMNPDIEAIQSVEPDLIICATEFSLPMLQQLEPETAVVVLENAANLEQLWQNYLDVGILLQGEQQGKQSAESFVQQMKSWFEGLKSQTTKQEPIKVAYIRELDFILATGDSLEGEILEQLGFENIAAEHSDWSYPKEEAEGEGRQDFQQLELLLFDDQDVKMSMLEQNNFYMGLPATVQDRYIVVNPAALERQASSMFNEFSNIAKSCWEDISVPDLDGDFTESEQDAEDVEDAEDGITDPQ